MKELFLDKSLVTNPNVTGELVLVYIALRKVMSDEVPLFSMNIKLFRLGRIKKKQTKTEDWQRFIIEYVKGMSIQ